MMLQFEIDENLLPGGEVLWTTLRDTQVTRRLWVYWWIDQGGVRRDIGWSKWGGLS